jgi:hypothetical protein
MNGALLGASTVGARAERRSRVNDESEAASTKRERKRVTLFRFGSNVGEIAVQPVFGSVNGAQFSLGF